MMEIKTYLMRELNGKEVEVSVHLTMNGITAIISHEQRRLLPELESVEDMVARALRDAAGFLEGGAVNLVNTGGPYTARS